MKQIVAAIVALTFAVPTTAAAADHYKVSVTRKDSNVYKVEGTDYWIKTKYCYEYAYSQAAIIVWNGKGSYSNKLMFLDYEGKKSAECDIEMLLVETEPR